MMFIYMQGNNLIIVYYMYTPGLQCAIYFCNVNCEFCRWAFGICLWEMYSLGK